MLVKYAVIASDKLMEVWTLSVHLCAERDGDRKKGNKIWPFAQKNNNCSSVRVTLRCGLLFASSVRAGQSQWAVREALQMTMWHVGVMERFSKAWDSSTLPLMVPAAWISALIIICTGTTKMTLFSLGGGGRDVFLSSTFLFPGIRKWSGDVTSLFAWHFVCPSAVQRGFCSSSLRTTQIFTRGITTAQHGKENIQHFFSPSDERGVGCKIAALLASVIIPKLLVPLLLWLWVCVFGRTDFWTLVPLPPNDEQAGLALVVLRHPVPAPSVS